jgi:hypothetical protein
MVLIPVFAIQVIMDTSAKITHVLGSILTVRLRVRIQVVYALLMTHALAMQDLEALNAKGLDVMDI